MEHEITTIIGKFGVLVNTSPLAEADDRIFCDLKDDINRFLIRKGLSTLEALIPYSSELEAELSELFSTDIKLSLKKRKIEI